MRKSLGEKRKEISADQITEITRLYGDFAEGEQVKIFPNAAFGYMRITIERPLRLRWEVTAESIAAVQQTKQWAKLTPEEHANVTNQLQSIEGTSTTDKSVLVKKLGNLHQRAIADYLDAETARIDALIVKKRAMVDLLKERDSHLLSDALQSEGFAFPAVLDPNWTETRIPSGWHVIRLSQVLRQLTNGYVGPTRDLLVDEGVRYVQSLHIKNGKIDFERRPFFVPEAWQSTAYPPSPW